MKESKEIYNASKRAYDLEHHEQKLERQRKWLHNNRDKANQYHKTHREKVRREVLLHYGNKCVCCGESIFEFLTLDHINGHGNEHRKAITGYKGGRIWQWLKDNNYPEGFQVLCYNCNCAKGKSGICPHERIRNERKRE